MVVRWNDAAIDVPLRILRWNFNGPGTLLLKDRFLINPFNAELKPICHLLVLLGAHHILHVSRIKVNGGI